jgi:hypothetical protein
MVQKRYLNCRRRSSSNPSGICQECGDKIFNKFRNACFCKNCAKKRIKASIDLANKKISDKKKIGNKLK